MPREYQRTKNNPYLLPHNLYMRVLYIIKDYDRLKDEYHAILDSSSAPPDGMPKGSGTSSPTEDKGIKLALISDELHAIEQALMTVPEEYRHGVKQNVLYGAWYPQGGTVRTYQRWKQRFVYHVAKRMNYI